MQRNVMLTAMLICAAANCLAAQNVKREDLGRSVKLMILVDKVMQPEEGWVTKEWMVKEAAEAGFNVFSPRVGHERLDEVRRVTEWCKKYGLYHMPWMRGTLAAPDGPKADGKRLVWASGIEQPLWSPNSDEFWEWTRKYIVEYARMSAETPNLMGVFLDYENYAPGRSGNCYSLSYDDVIMEKFARSKGIELPKLDLAKRKGWLEEQGLHEEFSAFQINHWRERCRSLRKAVDERDPTFRFCVYPAPGTLFMREAVYPEWATKKAPLILADACTYGRASRFAPQAEALEANRKRLLSRMTIPQERGIPFIYAGGIDPIVRGADPEFSGKNAVMISEATDGYWIFYEGPKYKKDHPDYFKWFSWANEAITRGDFKVWRQPRETDEDWALNVFKTKTDTPRLVLPEVAGKKVEYPIAKLRGENMLFLVCKAGQPCELTLKNQPVAYYESRLLWELRTASMEKLSSGMIPHGESGVITFTPKADGVYLLGASAGSCAYSVLSSTVPVGLYAAEGLSLIYGVKRLYFKAPETIERFTLTIKGAGGETVRVNIFDPDGAQVATAQTTLKTKTVKIEAPVGDNGGKVWSLEITRADEGVLEDNTITLDPNLPPTLSLAPEQVFGVGPAK